MNHAQLTALGRALRVLGEHGEALSADTPDARLHEVKDDLRRALDLLEESVNTAAPTTRCAEHPTGPVDKSAPDLCLLCETRRRTARRAEFNGPAPSTARPTPPRPATEYGRTARSPSNAGSRNSGTASRGNSAAPPPGPPRGGTLHRGPEPRPRAAMAYRLVHEFTDYEVLRVWGAPVRTDLETP
ncbi:hypothetical protein SHKM778_89650 [Streptomyces sp. KM77-8]|uniref:Uncharacterized protein n=1 Tax=Streptomyces haneummycinicus TaxID=3074435 RepID=A0AAT9HZ81_9ACTN